MTKLLLLLCALFSGILVAQNPFDLKVMGSYETGVFDEGAAEIVAYDSSTARVFFTNADTNSVTVLDVSDPSNPVFVVDISQAPYGGGVNCVAVANNIVAVTVEAEDATNPGVVTLWTTEGEFIDTVTVGALPDMLTFTNDGTKILVANEGEPNDDYDVDPEGSISIIDLSNGADQATVQTADFSAFIGMEEDLRGQGVRIFGPEANTAQDLEPEYVTISDDDLTAFAICQENNALAVIDIQTATVTAILPLGFKDHSEPSNSMDASNSDDAINIQNYPVFGMYQPDAIHYYNGYIFTANEGDSRDYDGFSEEERVKDLVLDSMTFPHRDSLQRDEVLGRLNITTTLGDIDNDGDYDEIYCYGARSFSVWNAATGELVWDSENQFETLLAQINPAFFNANNDDNDFDSRSDDKGPEPEAIEIAVLDGVPYALIGLERIGGIMVYNISDPTAPFFVDYVNNRNFYADAETGPVRDLGVEDIKFIPASQSHTGQSLVITSNEVSGTVTFWSVNQAFDDVVFDETIDITNWTPTEFVMPPSPLETQVIFVGGHDIVQTTRTYDNPAGRAIAKEWHDFIGWTPDTTGQSLGWATVNHEQIYRDDKIGDGGGMTSFRLTKNPNGTLEVIEQTLEDGRQGHFFNVDFVNTVGETGMNCAGISAPNGRIWTAEEWFRENNTDIWESSARTSSAPLVVAGVEASKGVRDTADFTIDAPWFPLVDGDVIPKYQNFNYMVEIDPIQAKAIRKQYNWGRAGWEGGAITEDMKTVYLGIDGSPAPFVKFEADVANDFTSGTLNFYKHDNAPGERWVEIPMDSEELVYGGMSNYCFANGATLFMRNEWVTIDQNTGIVYFSETGRDDSRPNRSPGALFAAQVANGAVTAPHHEALARQRGYAGATDEAYQDYYGRVMYYNPATEEMGVAVQGGPYFENSPSEAEYPDKHLSNPDGLKIITIDGESFLMISEDLNGTSNGRTPNNVSNRLCELYIVHMDNLPADVDDLIRITAIPAGAEVTGAIQIDENSILLNSQHPSVDNPFPYNHSLTAAINGFADVTVEQLIGWEEGLSAGLRYNAVTREVQFDEVSDYAIYAATGDRLQVYRNTQLINVGHLDAGTYYFLNAEDNMFELTIE